MMIEVQSSRFPLYDRNAQSCVDSIMYAPADAYQPREHRIHHEERNATYIELRIDAEE